MEMLSWAFKDDRWDEYTPEEQVHDILFRMKKMVQYEKRKDMRERFATPEQFEDEYPEGYEIEMSSAFRCIKEEIDLELAESMELSKEQKDFIAVLREFVEKDIETVLLVEDTNANQA